MTGAAAALITLEPPEDEFATTFCELFPPQFLFHRDCLPNTALFSHIRAICDSNGHRIPRRSGLMIAKAIAEKMYPDDLKREALQLISDSRKDTSQPVIVTSTDREPAPPQHTYNPPDISRKVEDTARHFSEKQKYSGILGENPSLPETKNAYLTYCHDKGFSPSEKVQLAHYALRGPAWTFWSSHIRDNPAITQIGSVFDCLTNKFDTATHQKQIDHIISSLSMKETVHKLQCGTVQALGHVYNEIDRLNPQGTKSKRGEVFKTEQLLHVVDNFEWAQNAKKRTLGENLSFAQIYSELSSSALLWEESQRKKGLDTSITSDHSHFADHMTSIHYGARYANPHHKRHTRNSNFKNRNKSEVTCYRCYKKGHYAFNCREQKRMTMNDAVRSRIRNQHEHPVQAAAKILFELTEQYDEHEATEEHNKDDIADDTFNDFLSSCISDENNDAPLPFGDIIPEHEQNYLS